MFGSWLKRDRHFEPAQSRQDTPLPAGAAIRTSGPLFLHIEAGARLALLGDNLYKKHFFCDWLQGFVEIPDSSVQLTHGSRVADSAKDRMAMSATLGRSALVYGETIQESMLYRTRGIRKQELYEAVERLYGPGLRRRTDPANPLLDPNGKPIPTQILTAREHLEIAQINLTLQQVPVIVLDLGSSIMQQALAEGLRPGAEFADRGRTMILILPAGRDKEWAEQTLGYPVSDTLQL